MPLDEKGRLKYLFPTKAKERGGGHVLASTKEFPNLIVDCLAFKQERLATEKAGAQAIVAAVLKAINYGKAHTNKANAIMAPHFQIDAKKYGLILSGARFCDVACNREFFGTTEAPGPIFESGRRAPDIWKEAGVIEATVDPKTIIATDLLPRQ